MSSTIAAPGKRLAGSMALHRARHVQPRQRFVRDVRVVQIRSSKNGSQPPEPATVPSVATLERNGPAPASTKRAVESMIAQAAPSSNGSSRAPASGSNGAERAPPSSAAGSNNGVSSPSSYALQDSPGSSYSGNGATAPGQDNRATYFRDSVPDASDSEGDMGDRSSPYAQTGFSALQRTFQIYWFALTFAFRYWRLGKEGTYRKMEGGMTPENVSAKKSELARWLRKGLIRLGPTFIKIGQQFSTRVDVLSQEFIKELEMLQDNVPPFGAAAVRETLERNLGQRVEAVFEEFDFTPLAAASLGQVHLARLNGRRVVVKVQRPGLRELFRVDLKNVRVIAQWLQRLDPKSDGAARDWVAIYDECSRILYEEIDYTQEADYAAEFAANFAGTSWIKVPEIYREVLTSEVLVMEYCPGVKINNAAAIDEMGLDRARLARLAVESYLQQLLTHGLFHADPHPGNVAVDSEGGGRLIYYDFGMMGRIPADVKAGLVELFYGVYQRDSDKCLDALAQMGVFVSGGDRTAIKRTADFFLDSFQQRLQEQREERERNPDSQNEFKPQRSKDDSKERRKAILANIGEDLLLASADKPFRFPAEFTFVVRSFTVLDGIGKSLSPRFDISEIAAPYARDLILDGRPQLARLQEKVAKGIRRQNRAVKGLFDGPLKIDEINETLKRIENGDTKPRVRALEVERTLARMQLWQGLMGCMVLASMFVNMGTVLSVSALPFASNMSFVAAGACGLFALINLIKVKQLERKEAQIVGAIA